MSLGASIVDSIPTVGTTVHTFDKIKDLEYVEYITVGGVDIPAKLSLRTSPVGNNRTRFGATLKYYPSQQDVASAVSLGGVTVSLNCDASLGSTMTPSAVADFVRYLMGAMLKATLIEALRDGSTQ
jgi:hypothetical protein